MFVRISPFAADGVAARSPTRTKLFTGSVRTSSPDIQLGKSSSPPSRRAFGVPGDAAPVGIHIPLSDWPTSDQLGRSEPPTPLVSTLSLPLSYASYTLRSCAPPVPFTTEIHSPPLHRLVPSHACQFFQSEQGRPPPICPPPVSQQLFLLLGTGPDFSVPSVSIPNH